MGVCVCVTRKSNLCSFAGFLLGTSAATPDRPLRRQNGRLAVQVPRGRTSIAHALLAAESAVAGAGHAASHHLRAEENHQRRPRRQRLHAEDHPLVSAGRGQGHRDGHVEGMGPRTTGFARVGKHFSFETQLRISVVI